MHIGKAVKGMAAMRGVTGRELGRRLGLSPHGMHQRLARQDWKYGQLKEAAEHLNVNVQDILDLAEQA